MGKLSVGKILAFGWRWYVGEQLAFGKFDAVGTGVVLLEIFN